MDYPLSVSAPMSVSINRVKAASIACEMAFRAYSVGTTANMNDVMNFFDWEIKMATNLEAKEGAKMAKNIYKELRYPCSTK